MMQAEFDRAVKLYREQTCQRIAKGVVRPFYCPVCAAIQYAPARAFDVASCFYSSDKLDSVPGINGQSRHDVLVTWLHRHSGQFTFAMSQVEDAEYRAGKASMARIEIFNGM